MIYNEENFPELPQGWASIAVDQAVESEGSSNRKLKSKDALECGRFPVIDQGQNDISGYSDDESLVVKASELSPVILFGDHTRLLKKITQPFVPGADGTKLFRAKSFWDTRFVYQMLRAIKLPDKGYARHYQYLRSSVLPLPPLPEQKRIADKLDAVLARVDACRDRLDNIPVILKRFRQSVLAAAASGKLTEDWRNQPSENMRSVEVTNPYSHTIVAPESWSRTSFGEVCSLIGGSQPPKSTFVSGESEDVVRLIQIRDYKSDKFKVFIPRKLARRFCNKTEVMIGRYGPPIFQILRGLEGAYNVALMKAEPKIDELELDYLFYWLKGDTLLRYVESGSERTAGQDGIRKELLNVYPFFLPPKNEQAEIVRRVEALFAYADRLEVRYAAASQQVEKLTPATLAKAFRGELVSQDPNDEPASVLLERIKSARVVDAIKPKRARKLAV